MIHHLKVTFPKVLLLKSSSNAFWAITVGGLHDFSLPVVLDGRLYLYMGILIDLRRLDVTEDR